ncbi:MAG: CaiB/BaiF CoA transferase family protein [Alphaproteobacteria bacterium]|tara:strand:- start:480 stop:1685 length:1206 start_codon:yes stop_codon:yes gene_type:complete
MDHLLEKITVIDCASYIAGPAAATIMSDFGARVIKIESPDIGDSYRSLLRLPGLPESDENYPWILTSRNKESLALDLKFKEAHVILHKLIKKADIFITNYPFPIRAKLKINSEDILKENKKLIYASLSPYGEKGHEKDKTGYDATAWWARSGLMHAVRSNSNSEPNSSVPGMGDHPTASALFGAIMMALYKREITGEGSEVSSSLMANGLWSNGIYNQAALCGANFLENTGRGTKGALAEKYKCKDGRWFILVMLNEEREWPLLLRCLKREDVNDDKRFNTREGRAKNSLELMTILDEEFLSKDWGQLKELFEKSGVTFGSISEPYDHINDKQIADNEFFTKFSDKEDLLTVDSPIFMKNEKKRKPQTAPEIGEHTRQILEELNYDKTEIEKLENKKIIRT